MATPLKVLVCGSRDWIDAAPIRKRLAKLPAGSTIIHGDSRGADRIAGGYARLYGFREHVFTADWPGQGRRAGILRNLAMLDEQPDLVLAFQRNGSRGTQHTVDEARARGIPVEAWTEPPPT